MAAKDEIRRRFSADPDRYYRVALFGEKGFERRACGECGRFFWSRGERASCPEHSDDVYSFIGDPPGGRRLDYAASWEAVRGFFESRGHAAIGRYPTVCRWRDDLYFTVASIVDFQRVMGSRVEFEFPANPLVVPQTCLRFKDTENVGPTGRHFTSFCMVGQHSVPDDGGYWKDGCIDLDYSLLTGPLGIGGDEVVFVEDVWEGGGSFGASLEYFVRGLELGNAVFTEFQGEIGSHTTLDKRIIDMGAGLERLAWVTSGTPTAYDCSFGPVTGELLSRAPSRPDPGSLGPYFASVARNAGALGLRAARERAMSDAGLPASAAAGISALEDCYTLADHTRTLLFAIADGALPSNVGGGYNLRMLLRRALGAAGRLRIGGDLGWMIDAHAAYLAGTYPELREAAGDVRRILDIEVGRHAQSVGRMQKAVRSLRGEPSVDDMVRLYESDGVTPEYLVEEGAIAAVPDEFYSRLAGLHQERAAAAAPPAADVAGLPETELLYYTAGAGEGSFEATVLRSSAEGVVLDRTNFYARGGGQEPDRGSIGGRAVADVSRHGGVVVHRVEGAPPAEGEAVRCEVDMERRRDVSAHHTCTHILNASARRVLGSWVWQHSAFKDAGRARLDITHHSGLSAAEVAEIEAEANAAIRADLPVSVREMERGRAEGEHGFRIYQGGVVPVSSVRVVGIGDLDYEACGGTHLERTGQAGMLKVTRTERVQDGVVRLEFAAGRAALGLVQGQEADMARMAGMLGADRGRLVESLARAQEGAEADRRRLRHLARRTLPWAAGRAAEGAEDAGGARFYGEVDGEMDRDYHIAVGRAAVEADPRLVYCALVPSGGTVSVVAYCGAEAQGSASAGDVARAAAAALGGSGGGGRAFAQGGGRDASRAREALAAARAAAAGKKG